MLSFTKTIKKNLKKIFTGFSNKEEIGESSFSVVL